MVGKVFFYLGLAFLILYIGSLFLLNSLNNEPKHIPIINPVFGSYMCDGCGAGGNAELTTSFLIGNSNPDKVTVSGIWPKQIDMNNSDTISLGLSAPDSLSANDFSPEANSTPVVPPTDPNRTYYQTIDKVLNADMYNTCLSNGVKRGDGMAVCTSSRTINNLFGIGYKASASAHLVTTSFDVQLLGTEERSVNQDGISWNWNITPKSSGIEVINADIEFTWKPTTLGNENIIRYFWKSPIIVTVNPLPPFSVGQFTLSSTFTGVSTVLFGGLSIPWIIEQRQKRKEEKQKAQEESKPSNKDNLTQVTSSRHLQLVQKQRAIKLAQRRRNPH